MAAALPPTLSDSAADLVDRLRGVVEVSLEAAEEVYDEGRKSPTLVLAGILVISTLSTREEAAACLSPTDFFLSIVSPGGKAAVVAVDVVMDTALGSSADIVFLRPRCLPPLEKKEWDELRTSTK